MKKNIINFLKNMNNIWKIIKKILWCIICIFQFFLYSFLLYDVGSNWELFLVFFEFCVEQLKLMFDRIVFEVCVKLDLIFNRIESLLEVWVSKWCLFFWGKWQIYRYIFLYNVFFPTVKLLWECVIWSTLSYDFFFLPLLVLILLFFYIIRLILINILEWIIIYILLELEYIRNSLHLYKSRSWIFQWVLFLLYILLWLYIFILITMVIIFLSVFICYAYIKIVAGEAVDVIDLVGLFGFLGFIYLVFKAYYK